MPTHKAIDRNNGGSIQKNLFNLDGCFLHHESYGSIRIDAKKYRKYNEINKKEISDRTLRAVLPVISDR